MILENFLYSEEEDNLGSREMCRQSGAAMEAASRGAPTALPLHRTGLRATTPGICHHGNMALCRPQTRQMRIPEFMVSTLFFI